MDEERKEQMRLERVASGVPGLDTVLAGGFLRGGTYIISGAPGTGKTILGNQICFHHVASGGRAVYVTLLAESAARMLSLIGTLGFFNPEPVASSLVYISAYKTMEQKGLAGLLELLRHVVRDHRASMLVVDGLVSAEAVADSELAFKKFIHELHTLVTYIDCTTFLLTNGRSRETHPEETMVDGLLELSDQLVGLRAVRELIVRKFRGSPHLRGLQFFAIDGDGIHVYPRIEEVLGASPRTPQKTEKLLPFGIPSFDELLLGGVLCGSTTLVLGPSGSGKTLLGMHFLAEGARRREPGMYFGFFEAPPRLVSNADGIGLGFSELCREGHIQLVWQPPVDLLIDALAERILEEIRLHGTQRLFIDGLGGFKEAAVYPERLGRFFAAFTNELRALGVTTLLTEEPRHLFGPGIELPATGLSAAVENVFFLRQVEFASQLRRLISVLKTRDREHNPELREFFITPQGLSVAAPFASAEAMMSGLAHEIPPGQRPSRRARSTAPDRGRDPGEGRRRK